MIKRKIFLALFFSMISSLSWSINSTGFYWGLGADAIYYFAYYRSSQKSSTSGGGTTYNLDKKKEKEGYGGSVFIGKSYQADSWILAPELSVQMDNGHHKKYGNFSNGVLSTVYERPINISANLVGAYPLTNTYDIQGILGLNFSQFKFTGMEDSASSTAYRYSKKFYNMGIVGGVGVEKKFESWALGCQLKQYIYLRKRINYMDRDGDRWSSQYRASFSNFTLRVRVPF